MEPRATIHHEFIAHLKEISWIVNATLVVVHFKIDGNKISLSSLHVAHIQTHNRGENNYAAEHRCSPRRRRRRRRQRRRPRRRRRRRCIPVFEPRTYIRRRFSYNCTICLLALSHTRHVAPATIHVPDASNFYEDSVFGAVVAEARLCLTHMQQTLAAPVRLPNS